MVEAGVCQASDCAQLPMAQKGITMPAQGLGTWKAESGKTGESVKIAIRNGYRMIDCANDYGNEAEIGKAIKACIDEGIVKREDLFLQAKLWNGNHRKEHVRPDLMATLEKLQTDYIDSYVIHWPQAAPSVSHLKNKPTLEDDGVHAAIYDSNDPETDTMFPIRADNGTYHIDAECHYIESWQAMEELLDEGLCKAIGLSNFNKRQIEEVRTLARHPVSVLQNECHPYFQQKDLMDYCRINKIIFQAYSPLCSRDRPWAGRGPPGSGSELLDDATIGGFAKKYNRTPAQITLRWHFQCGRSFVPKSVTPERIISNYQIWDFELTRDDMEEIAKMNINWRHLLWPECAEHMDYPFKDELPYDYTVPPVPADATAGKR